MSKTEKLIRAFLWRGAHRVEVICHNDVGYSFSFPPHPGTEYIIESLQYAYRGYCRTGIINHPATSTKKEILNRIKDLNENYHKK